MFYKQYVFLLLLCYLFFFKSTTVYGLIDPITGSLTLGAFLAGYLIHQTDYAFPFFNSRSCPNEINIDALHQAMNNNFFGQHIAQKIILSTLKGNIKRSNQNKKPLVMSFHGWTGCGKNFVVDLIANHMFQREKVRKLRHHMFNGRSEFFMQSRAYEYRIEIHKRVKSALQSCNTNLFIFDELHYIPMGVLDVLIPILENNDLSVDSRNSIFIFLTNAGSDAIVQKFLSLWDKGYKREQMKIQDFDSVIQKSSFNEIGAFKRSQLIDSHIVDHYVPFLPLEKHHVVQCIEREFKNLNKSIDDSLKNQILKMISFGPEPQKLFSTSGCKRINTLVTTESHPILD